MVGVGSTGRRCRLDSGILPGDMADERDEIAKHDRDARDGSGHIMERPCRDKTRFCATRKRRRRRRHDTLPPSTAVLGNDEDSAASQHHGTRSTCRRPQRSLLIYSQMLLSLLVTILVGPGSAVLIDFDNCLAPSVKNDKPPQLHFVPLYVDASFNAQSSNHTLRLTVWGNVTGSLPKLNELPPASATDYWNNNATDNNNGKIVDIPFPDSANKITTLFRKVNVLTYEPWSDAVDFCNQLKGASCPLGPSFGGNSSDRSALPSFGFEHSFDSSYAFTTFTANLRVANGDAAATTLACISANVTPRLGSGLSGVLRFLPLVVLIVVGIATAFAGVYSPWGSTDVFRWTTNYGRDADLLRLVTPGFGDCLQYIQFVALTGGLTLDYPGYYQPVVSKVSWSALMFNESLVGSDTFHRSLVDGIYVTHGRFGLDRLRQLVGLQDVDDVWTGMIVWLLSIIAITLFLIQLGFVGHRIYRRIHRVDEEDLRSKNLPMSVGNVIRIVFNYFLLPIVALSTYQLVEAGRSPAYTVALAAITLINIIGFAVWLLYFIVRATPKAILFDDLPTVLLYGSLYNNYSDSAAPFALIPMLLTFVRGIAIGAVQASGITQLVLLAICEVITVLTLHAFRPFHSPTSMNAYHTFFAVFRFTTILLMISFAASLGVTDGPKGWIGYSILLMHAVVLVFGFLLNAIQTIVEVAARMTGAGGDENGALRGGLVKILGVRQLSKRSPRRDVATSRQSQLSGTLLMKEADRKSYVLDSPRPGSTNPLNRHSSGLDSLLGDGLPRNTSAAGLRASYSPDTPGLESSPFASAPNSGNGTPTNEVAVDPYYRPPRTRRPTVGSASPIDRRASYVSGPWTRRESAHVHGDNTPDTIEQEMTSRRASVVPHHAPVDENDEKRRSQADFATREVDFYYGVRGPALNSHVPSRRIKTGPVDPTAIAPSAVGWFKGLFGNKTKDQGKGFEVVRSSRMPPGMLAAIPPEPPEGVPVATGGIRNGPIDSDDEDDEVRGHSQRSLPRIQTDGAASHEEHGGSHSPVAALSDSEDTRRGDGTVVEVDRAEDLPTQAEFDMTSPTDLEPPSRSPARLDPMSSTPLLSVNHGPSIPRKSSRRKSASVDIPALEAVERQEQEVSTRVSGAHFGNAGAPDGSRDLDPNDDSEHRHLPSLRHDHDADSAVNAYKANVGHGRPTSLGFVPRGVVQVEDSDRHDASESRAEVISAEERQSLKSAPSGRSGRSGRSATTASGEAVG